MPLKKASKNSLTKMVFHLTSVLEWLQQGGCESLRCERQITHINNMKFTPTTKFIYNEESRVHTLGKSIIPSVTQVIAPLCDYSRVPARTLNHKRDLGVAFHEAIRLYLHGDLDENSIDPQLVKPIEAFEAFWAHKFMGKTFTSIIEKPVYHPKLKYAGKPDLVTESAIYDWKLRPYNKVSDPLQMAGYKELCPSVNELVVVCFGLDGSYKVHHAFNAQAWPMFRLLLGRWKSEQKFNLFLNKWKESVK